ncbi:hypothetical protein N5P37_011394 [Trichoderma harzianum]|nr:hypothetical protein N5P37_011394 [Trichoderma harzianum]
MAFLRGAFWRLFLRPSVGFSPPPPCRRYCRGALWGGDGPCLGSDGLGHQCLCRRGTPPGREPGEACRPREFYVPEGWPPGDVWGPSFLYVVVWEGLMP